ncbi:uncharacterized protein EMH_0065600 [Eimeria mitis]|uniref:Uncharacterized protein n=1 Tax=Eimeria mitis TaxID=44415 RepID=U6K0N2_9EIME|nr:uncharacterized protein EMH_0065600 [Eimeria mitis]CDJ31305.1 hypothetical protein EMH_0065600 [Eimeria mitis]
MSPGVSSSKEAADEERALQMSPGVSSSKEAAGARYGDDCSALSSSSSSSSSTGTTPSQLTPPV